MNSIRKPLLILGYTLGFIVIIATLFSALPVQNWWARVCDYVPLQLLVMEIIAATILIVFKWKKFSKGEWIYMTLLFCAFIYHLEAVYPYTPLRKYRALPAEVLNDPSRRISIVYCNVLQKNYRSDLCLKEVLKYKPDILLFAETDIWWHNRLQVLKKDYPYFAEMPLQNTYGMLFYSKLPFESKGFEYLIKNDIPSIAPIITLRNGAKVQCYFIHPRPPVPGESEDSQQRDSELMLTAKRVIASEYPVIVAGDLNDVGWSPSSILFQKNSQLLDPRIGRGIYATFNANYPMFRWPLDHIFISREFRIAALEKLGYTGSDHFPIYIDLSFEPEGKYEQHGLDLRKQDIQDANEKLKDD
jgi:endonuclease/exonuclease/phosphatase (EEP) superfamily protein YafD